MNPYKIDRIRRLEYSYALKLFRIDSAISRMTDTAMSSQNPKILKKLKRGLTRTGGFNHG